MAARYHINPTDNLISLKVEGGANLADLRALGQALLADPDFRPGWPQLVDLRDIELDPGERATRPFLDYLNRDYHPQAGNIAVVVDGTLPRELFAAIYRVTCTLDGTEIFDDYRQAIRWLLGRLPVLPQEKDTGADRTH